MNHHFAQLSTMDLLKFCFKLICYPLYDFRLGYFTFNRALILDNIIFHVSISIVVWCTPAVFQDNCKIGWCFESFWNQWSLKIDFDIQNFFQCQYRWLWNNCGYHVIEEWCHVVGWSASGSLFYPTYANVI